MKHFWGLITQIIDWASDDALDALSVLESLLAKSEFVQAKLSFEKGPIPANVHEMGLAEKWLPRLQILVKQAPRLVDDSRILNDMYRYYEASDASWADEWVRKLHGLRNALASELADTKGQVDPEYKENISKNIESQDIS
jgi:hypothetical protein